MKLKRNVKAILKEMNYGFERMMIRAFLLIIFISIAVYAIIKYF